MYKKPRLVIIFILLLTLSAIFINVPKVTLFNRTFTQPKFVAQFFGHDLTPKLGLDLAGGVQLTMSADMTGIEKQDQDSALESAKNIVSERINSLGVAEASVQSAKTQGQNRLVVEIPGINNIDEAIDLVKRAAHLEFKVLSPEAKASATASADVTSFVPSGLTGKDLTRAMAQPSEDPQNPGYVVNLEFNGDGTKKLQQITTDNINAPMAMFLDDQAVSWPPPTIRSQITDGHAQISGNFTAQDAKQLAIQLNSGALPVPLKVESQTRIGPTIGREAIQKSITATAIGLASVAVFMLVYYRVLGAFAVGALALYALLVFSIFKIFGVTLTLAGIAGFVLSIGMAVDANILIFERIKEERKWGKPKHEALYAGFDRAWSSIRDSNLSSLITTAILFYFGTGAIRGFALTLAIGILISMFSAITVTRNLLKMFWVGKI